MQSIFTENYIQTLKNPFLIENLKFIIQNTHKSTDPGFIFLFNNADSVNSVLGANTSESFIMGIIQKEEIQPYNNDPNPDWDEIENKIIKKYGALGQERIWGIKMIYYTKVEDWKNFGKYYKLYFDRAIPLGRSFIHINNLSWPVFEHINDPAILQTAINATKFNLSKFESSNPSSIDTHANLLYKAGKKTEAILWERIAVKLSNNEDVFVETLDKMEKGLPTWNEGSAIEN
jgi:hypothetical protein